MSKTKGFLLAVAVAAMAFTFSCSSDDDGGGGSDKGNDIGNYRTVVIGTQTWMAENLNYAVAGSKCHGEGGEVVIGYDGDDPITTKTLSNAEVQANCDKYGRLYDWSTAMNFASSCNSNSCSNQIQTKHRGVCPYGWHIPSDAEWGALVTFAGGSRVLKAASGWDYNGNGTNDYGFSALPGGYGESKGFFGIGQRGRWWSATEYNASSTYFRIMYNTTNTLDNFTSNKSDLNSIRCVQD